MNAEQRRSEIVAAARQAFLESGLSGTSLRDIARRAGITEGLLYHHFSSKDEIFRTAVEEPLNQLTRRLRDETHALAGRPDVSKAELLEQANELFLGAMVTIAPLLAVTLFADVEKGREFYRTTISPRLRTAVEAILTDIRGWTPEGPELELAVQTFLGVHYSTAMDAVLAEIPLDVPAASRLITELYSLDSTGLPTFAPPPAAPPRTRLNGEIRRAGIIEAARETFLSAGFAATRTKDIAERAGMEEAGLYRHFSSKLDMWEQAIEAPLRSAIDALPMAAAGSSEEVLRDLVARMIELGPLLAVSLFAGVGRGPELYAEHLMPRLRAAVASVTSSAGDPLTAALLGIAVDHAVQARPVDVARVAAELQALLDLRGR
jgi:AcrR family transcriptional regulator